MKYILTLLILLSGIAYASDNTSLDNSTDNSTDNITDNSTYQANKYIFFDGGIGDEVDNITDNVSTEPVIYTDNVTGLDFILINADNVTFFMATTEVHQGLWLKIMRRQIAMFKRGNNHPMENLRFTDVTSFLQKLRKTGGYSYRLPSIYEWQLVADNGLDTGIENICKQFNLYDVTSNNRNFFGNKPFACEDGHIYTTEVASLEPNKFGVYDIYGNVSEWTCDVLGLELEEGEKNYGEEYCISTTSAKQHSLVGGSFSEGVNEMKSPIKTYSNSHKFGGSGFRLVIDAVNVDGKLTPKVIE